MLRVLTVAGALLVIAQLHRASGGVMSLELDQSFGLSASEIGLVIGAMLLASAVAQLPAGLAFDRFGPRRTVSAMVVLALLGTLLLAVARSFLGLAFARFLIGAGFAGVVTSIMLLAMHWAPPERFATVAATVLALGSAHRRPARDHAALARVQDLRLDADLPRGRSAVHGSQWSWPAS